MPADLDVQRTTESAAIPDDVLFQHWVDTVLDTETNQASLTIRIVDETEARRFNRDYRNKDYATNVLSFPAELPEGLPLEIRQAELGDILICAPVVAREAGEQGRPEVNHWAHLTVHGVLHLLGHDHEKSEEAILMESLEIQILAKLGVSDPYKDLT